jgi:hypothetical protein
MRTVLTLAWMTLATLAAVSCGFGHDVAQDGDYVIVPPEAVTDSAPYSLETLLRIERDVKLSQTRLYCFRGDLRSADLGLEDLRRVAARHGGFQMAFDAAKERLEDDDAVESHGKALAARVGSQNIELVRLDDKGLKQSGAARFLSSVSSTDYAVAAYFGVIEGDGELGTISIERAGLEYARDDSDASPNLEFNRDDAKIELKYQTSADFVVVELAQGIQEKTHDAQDATPLDALVRTSLPPDTPYVVMPTLLTNVAGQGCWKRSRPLEARLHQVSRRYQMRSRGDWAVVYERIDSLEVGSGEWTALLGDVKPSPYCKDYE